MGGVPDRLEIPARGADMGTMTTVDIMERFGDAQTMALAGLVVGLAFGIAAQASAFCLRAATVEVGRGTGGTRLGVWLLAAAAAILGTQVLAVGGFLDLEASRYLDQGGSLSGALLGGALFGAGMILSRGCSGRLLILSATGNLRAVFAVAVFAVTAWLAYDGALVPVREAITGLWRGQSGAAEATGLLGLGTYGGIGIGALLLAFAVITAVRTGTGWVAGIAALATGGAIVLGWWATSTIAALSFDPMEVESVTFSRPFVFLAEGIAGREPLFSFGSAMLGGVLIGAFVSALLRREVRVQRFGSIRDVPRYALGAVFMGVGAVAAGGCATGALTGTTTFAVAPLLALVGIALGAMVTDRLVDHAPGGQLVTAAG